MNYLTVKDVAEKWNITPRRVVSLIGHGQIIGAIKKGGSWQIPENVQKPDDQRYSFSLNPQKKCILVLGQDCEVKNKISKRLVQEGYVVTDKISDGLDGFVYFDDGRSFEKLATEVAGSLESMTAMVRVGFSSKAEVIKRLAVVLHESNIKVNEIVTDYLGLGKNEIGFCDEVADDILLFVSRHKCITGQSIFVDAGRVGIHEQRTQELSGSMLYRYFDKFISSTGKNDKIWAISMMMPNEWSVDHQEKKFREDNINAATRGVDVERIFVFDFSKQDIFKDNMELKRYVLNKYVSAFAVDRCRLEKENPKLLNEIANGLFAINFDKIFIDYPADNGQSRGYISFDKNFIYNCRKTYEKLKKYAIKVSNVIK